MGSYTIVTAPTGTGLHSALKKLEAALPAPVEIAVVEDRLLEATRFKTLELLTRSLSRDRVISLWQEALRTAATDLMRRPGEEGFRLLACRMTLFSGRRREQYSVRSPRLLEEIAGRPSHVLLLMDDIYDCYQRLSETDELYDKDVWPATYAQDTLDVAFDELEPGEERRFVLESKVSALRYLLALRRIETLFAESLAREFACPFLALGTKQPVAVAAGWLQHTSPQTVYISHPISRPRRSWRMAMADRVQSGADLGAVEWPPVVNECNSLPGLCEGRNVTPVMPTAIDEQRISAAGRDRTSLLPALDARWPLIDGQELLYEPPSNAPEAPEYKTLLAGADGDPGEDRGIEPLLRNLEASIMGEVPFRDHLLVASCKNLLVFRPLYESGRFSGGVRDEIYHWREMALHEPKCRIAFLHHADDIQAYFPVHANSIPASLYRKAVQHLREHPPDGQNLTDRQIESILNNEPGDQLSGGTPTWLPKGRANNVRQDAYKVAGEAYLWERLTSEAGAEDLRTRVALRIYSDSTPLRRVVEEVCDFLRGDPWRGPQPIPSILSTIGDDLSSWAISFAPK